MPRIIFRATTCSLSMECFWAWVRLSCHTTEQYSMEDLICRQYICNSFDLDIPAYFNLVSIDILAYVLFMICLVLISQQLGSSQIHTPRIFIAVCLSMSFSSRVKRVAKSSLTLVCNMYFDLSEFSFIVFWCVHRAYHHCKIELLLPVEAESVAQLQYLIQYGLESCTGLEYES